jgi:hypothetical protein
MSDAGDAFLGGAGIYLLIGADGETVSLRCDTHPEFVVSCKIGSDRRVPAAWVIGTQGAHLVEHFSLPKEELAEEELAEGEAAEEEPERLGAGAVSELDVFGREVVARCRWAIDFNEGDPFNSWPDLYRIAVALVLGNHLYLREMGPGPGYSPEEAAVFLVRGMEHRPADLGAWIGAIRAEVRSPEPARRGDLWLPASPAPGVEGER